MSDIREPSPTSETYSDGVDSISMRDKSLIKRSISKHHNNNFTAGYVPVHEQHLQKTGLRGRKTFAFWTLVGLLFVLAVGNLILTMTILGVLRLGQGMQSLELVPENAAIKLFGNTDLNDIYKRDGKLEGFIDYPVDITGYNGSVVVKLAPKNGRSFSKLIMNKNGTILRNTNTFEVKSNKNLVFTTNYPNFYIGKQMNNLKSKTVHSSRIVSSINENLEIEARNIILKGAEGTLIESKQLHFTADRDLHIKSLNGSIILESLNGTVLDTKKLPLFVQKYNGKVNLQYKVCVCMPQGKLFKIPVTKDDTKVFCDHINISQFNPCL